MKHELFAAFFRKANECKPAYRCPLGIITTESYDYFKENGFTLDENATDGYLDYLKELKTEELGNWTHEDCQDEVLDVLSCGEDFERILLQAEEFDTLDDEGTIPVRGLPICECFVQFSGTAPFAPVTFMEGDPYHRTEDTRYFIIPLTKLKGYFDVLTMLEVMDRMRIFGTGQHWSYDQLKEYFEAGIDDAVDLATRVFFGKRDLDGNPEILHALNVGMSGNNKTEMIVGFLHDVLEDSDLTAEDLWRFGYSKLVIETVQLLTHDKDVPYLDYIRNIVRSGNIYAMAVKINDLKHNIARGNAGGHTKLVAKHTEALDVMQEEIRAIQEIMGD